jgi:hypothetical protein
MQTSTRVFGEKIMFKPTVTKEWLLATMEMEGDGFINAGGIREATLPEEFVDTSFEETRGEELVGRIHFSTTSVEHNALLSPIRR